MIDYPTHLTVDGVEYAINQHWKIGFECLNVIEDPELNDVERAVQLIVLLLGDVSDEIIMNPETMQKVTTYLLCENKQSDKQPKKVMDYNQDMAIIWSSIKADYGVDIFKEDVNWYEFNNMIAGLSDTSGLMKRIEIRQMDPSKEKDQERRKLIVEAQKQVALDVIDNEIQVDEKTAAFLEAMGKRVKL